MIHVDTSFLIRGLVRGSAEDGWLRRWLGAGERLAMCAIAWTELLCGPIGAEDVTRAARLITDRRAFVEEDAGLAARLFNLSGRRRGSLADCMIAGAAIRADAPLATNNADDFTRFLAHGLVLLPTALAGRGARSAARSPRG
jgi:predicted nucleic acid-binding protein